MSAEKSDLVSLPKEVIVDSIRTFKRRRDDLLHEDVAAFDHHCERFLTFCSSDQLVQSILAPLEKRIETDTDAWWSGATTRFNATLAFPADRDEELVVRYRVIRSANEGRNRILSFGFAHGQKKLHEAVELFRTLVIRPFVEDVSQRLGDAADLATPEARAVQAVPLSRIPTSREVRIFLSHKSVDKPLVYRYHDALKALGFDPWLDEPELPAGANLERGLLQGFEESCAAVFFITESFTDEKYLATEVDYAILQKRKKDKKFAIITLLYADAAPVPGLLTPFVYKPVSNDLEGFSELVKALPIELGPVRWKETVV
ncbi:MAG: toll/interleukin-1 receptor domain-containing protein [Chloroflexi bacterium]|nr:toll/interleukin-1 receptor domain-containing protein [Chloroflexota bacterium]